MIDDEKLVITTKAKSLKSRIWTLLASHRAKVQEGAAVSSSYLTPIVQSQLSVIMFEPIK